MLTDVYKLVNGAHTCQDREITKGNMPGHLCIVAHDAVVADHTIVGNMTVSHDEAIVANLGGPFIFAATVDRHKLTYSGIVADLNGGVFAFIFQVLGNTSNYSSRENAAVIADAGALHDGYIAADPGAFSNFYILMDHAEWVNFYIGGQFGVWVDVCVRMNHLLILKIV
jgi:hypothetical protein